MALIRPLPAPKGANVYYGEIDNLSSSTATTITFDFTPTVIAVLIVEQADSTIRFVYYNNAWQSHVGGLTVNFANNVLTIQKGTYDPAGTYIVLATDGTPISL